MKPFRIEVPEDDLADLRARVANVRWPEAATAPGWRHGVPLDVMQALCRYWVDGYDWRATEARLNAVPQYLLELDGLQVHLLHARSPHPGALPLILTHGWPGSVLEWVGLVGSLTHPTAHGGTPDDAFDVVIPSLPGYGFSAKPTTPGWGIERIARSWAGLMAVLGYRRYGAAGSDWGTSISSLVASLDADHVAGVHLIPPLAGPDRSAPEDLTEAERSARADLEHRGRWSSAYGEVHRTAPQTLGYALVDSPVGLCAWMAEKLCTWADSTSRSPDLRPRARRAGLSRDQMLDQVSLYWLTGTAASAARLYAESIEQVAEWIDGSDSMPAHVPVGASIFPAEVPRPSRRWASRRYPNIQYWKEHAQGGHFPALEAPDVLVNDLRTFFRPLR